MTNSRIYSVLPSEPSINPLQKIDSSTPVSKPSTGVTLSALNSAKPAKSFWQKWCCCWKSKNEPLLEKELVAAMSSVTVDGFELVTVKRPGK